MTTEPVVKRGENEKLPVLCPFKKRKLDEAGCQEICIRPLTNEKICTKQFHCKSPYKFCWKCLEMGRDTDANLAEGRIGLCAEHLKSHNIGEKTSTVDLPPQKLFRTPPPALAPFKRPVEPEVGGAFSKTENTLPMSLPNRAMRRGGSSFMKEPTAQQAEKLIRALPKNTAPKVVSEPEVVKEKPLQAPAKTAPVVTSVPKKPHIEKAKEDSVRSTFARAYVAKKISGDQESALAEKLLGKQIPVDTVLEVDCSLVFPLEDQPRTYFDKVQLKGLINSIAEAGQIQVVPAVSLPDGTFRIRDGERRWRACTELKRPLRIIVIRALSHEEEIEQAAIANFLPQGHTALEKARLFRRLTEGPLKRSVPEVAQKFNVTAQTVYNHLIVLKRLTPVVLEYMDPVVQGSAKGLIGLSTANLLTAFFDHPEKQEQLAKMIVEKKLNSRKASLLLDKEARALGLKAGRGRESKPHDYIGFIKRMLTIAGTTLERFSNFSAEDWDKVWRTHPWTERKDVAKRLLSLITQLQKLHEHVSRSLSKK